MDACFLCKTTFRQHRAGDEQDKPGNEEDLVALGRALGLLVLLLRRDLAKEPAVDCTEGGLGRACRCERNIAPLARLRDRLQRRFLKLHPDGLSLELLLAATVFGRNRRAALRVSNADREDWNAALLRKLRVLDCLAAQVPAVGDENDRIMVVRRRIKRIERRANGTPEIRLAARSRLGRKLLEGVPEIGVVRREGTDRDTRPAERNERAPVAFQRIDKVRNISLRPLQPVRTHVRRKHRT